MASPESKNVFYEMTDQPVNVTSGLVTVNGGEIITVAGPTGTVDKDKWPQSSEILEQQLMEVYN